MIGQLLAERYLIVEKLGSGGFSETYLACDKYLPCHPLCVVKYFRLSADSSISVESAQRLFEAEARVLDRLGQQHPQIPTLLAYCQNEDELYQVQEYVEGETLSHAIAKGHSFTSDDAIAILQQGMTLLSFVHSQQIIHRDIKPSHLIRRKDGRLVLIDFGAALALQPSVPTATIAIGTEGYMPPEQETGLADASSDLYALGMSVIQMLTGVSPRQISCNPITGELEWHPYLQGRPIVSPHLVQVLERLVQRHPRARYRTAAEALAALQTTPKKQRPAPKLPRFPQWQQAWRPTALLLLALGGWAIVGNLSSARLWLSRAEAWVQSEEPLKLVQDQPRTANIDRMLISPNEQLLVTAEADYSLRLWSLPTGTGLATLTGHRDRITTLAISKDGRWLVSGSNDQTVRLWDTTSNRLVWQAAHPQAITALAISPDGQMVASSGAEGTLRLWDTATGELLRTLSAPPITALSFGATADQLISADRSYQLQVWNLQTGTIDRTFAGHKATVISLQMIDDRRLYSFGEDRTLVWDLEQENLAQVFPKHEAKLDAALLGKDHAITVYENGSLQVWNHEGQLMNTLSGGFSDNQAIAISPQHRYLVCFTADRRLRIWQVSQSAIP